MYLINVDFRIKKKKKTVRIRHELIVRGITI